MRYIFNEGGIGDSILLSAVAENSENCLASSRNNDLLEGNPRIKTRNLKPSAVFSNPSTYAALRQRGQDPFYVHYWELYEKELGVVRWHYPKIHMIAKMCARAGVYGDIRVAPKIYLSDEEVEKGRVLDTPFIVMQSTGACWKTAGFETWAKVAEKLHKDYPIIQIGGVKDRPLPHAQYLCDTLSLRQFAAVLANACLFLGMMGGFMHMARAVGTRSVISFSDSEPSSFSGYIANEHAESETRCDFCRSNSLNMFNGDNCPMQYSCCTSISSDSIVRAFERIHARLDEPIECEIVNNEKEKEKLNPCLLYYKTQLRPISGGFIKREC